MFVAILGILMLLKNSRMHTLEKVKAKVNFYITSENENNGK